MTQMAYDPLQTGRRCDPARVVESKWERGVVDEVQRQLTEAETVAVVGMSGRPQRPSHYVAEYLMRQGYRIIPVNPAIEEVLGLKSYPDLVSVPERIDLVDIFRRPEYVPAIVDEAIQVGAKYIWMQDGVVHPAAADTARRAGLSVVMDNCMLREHMARFGA